MLRGFRQSAPCQGDYGTQCCSVSGRLRGKTARFYRYYGTECVVLKRLRYRVPAFTEIKGNVRGFREITVRVRGFEEITGLSDTLFYESEY